jgi:uncharacterized protein YndB with AHSA1/START domain
MYHSEQTGEGATMAVQEIDVRGTTPAPPGAVWRLLGDSSTWPSWTPIEGYELERPGGDDGLGEIRRFTTGRVKIREEIVQRDAERRLTYTLLSGLALRDYRAEIDLTPTTDGTSIRWHTTFRPKVPGSGWIYRRALDKATREFVDGLARASAA